MLTKLLFLLLTLTPTLSYQQYKATKTIHQTISLQTAIQTLHCKTHSGHIHVHADPDPHTTKIHLESEISVLRPTQTEANETLNHASVSHEIDSASNQVRILRVYDDAVFHQSPPFYSFVLRIPPFLALQLESHHGTIVVDGTSAAITAKTHDGGILLQNTHNANISAQTHNGSVQGSIDQGNTAIKTHNGPITLQILHDDTILDVNTHKGDMHLKLPTNVSTRLDMKATKGKVTVPCNPQEVVQTKKYLKCLIGENGDTRGRVTIGTKGGSVEMEQMSGVKSNEEAKMEDEKKVVSLL